MSSSGLKLRDTRELLANPDQSEDLKIPFRLSTSKLDVPVTSHSTNCPTSAEVVTSMSPSLAMANAEASPSPHHKDNANTEAAATATLNTRRESEPIPKKRRLLEATEVVQDDKDQDQQPQQQDEGTEDILARACFAVGLDSDLVESVVEEPLPTPEAEINGELHRIPENYHIIRGVRPPPPGLQIPPRMRHPEEVIIHRQIHPAYRPPGNGTYGVEVRPPYNPAYAVQHRGPIHPGERHRYYAVHHYPRRYPYPIPPGSIPPPHRSPLLRPMPPNGPHERHALVHHGSPAYPYDPQRLPRPSVLQGSHPHVSPIPHDTRREPPELRHAPPVGPDGRPLHPRHHEISYIRPPHDISNPAAFPPEQLSTAITHHPHSRTGPIPIQPKIHNNHPHAEDPRSSHPTVQEGHVPRGSPGIPPPMKYPHPLSSPQELSCRNPFELPEPQVSQKMLLVPESVMESQQQERLCMKIPVIALEKDKVPSAAVRPASATEKREGETKAMEVKQSVVTIDKSSNGPKSRRPREPPKPCVELIPIGIPSRENSKAIVGNTDKKVQESITNSGSYGNNSTRVKSSQVSPHDKKSLSDKPPTHNTNKKENMRDSARSEQLATETGKSTKTRNTRKNREFPSHLPSKAKSESTSPTPKENSNKKPEGFNKAPKRSFRKRWLDKPDLPASKRQARPVAASPLDKKIIPSEVQAASLKDNKADENKVVVAEDSVNVTHEPPSQTIPDISSSQTYSKARAIGPGQLHCLHSSSCSNQNRSASEPPIGASASQDNSQASSNRPASLPGVTQQFQIARGQDESQKTGNHSSPQIKKDKLEANTEENDSAFIARLNLVLNDLISVPEATKLQHLTCPVEELLASLVKRRGAKPSDDPSPRQRLRQDFLVLVKLCMPPNLIEAWGWNKCTPEEILDELIKVTNNGVDSIMGSASKQKNDHHNSSSSTPYLQNIPPPPPLSTSPSHRTLPPSTQALPSPQPLPVTNSTDNPNLSPHHRIPPPLNHPLSGYHQDSTSSPVLTSHHQVLHSSHHPSMASHHHATLAHRVLPSHPPISPSSVHPSISPRHSSLSPHVPVPASPNHPSLSPHHRLSVPPQSPHSQVSHLPSHSSPSPHHSVPTNHPSLSPQHPVPHHPNHLTSSPHQPTQRLSNHPSQPYHPATSGHQPDTWTTHSHSVPHYSRHTTLSSTHNEPSMPHDEHLEDEVFSPMTRDPPHQWSHPDTQALSHPQLHSREPNHESASSSSQMSRMHPAHTQPTNPYAHSAHNAHPQQIPVSVLQYSQQSYSREMPPQIPNAPPHYTNETHNSPRIRHPSHYPRSAYPQSYAYNYYPQNTPQHPPVHPYRPPYHPGNILHRPHNLPNHPYNPQNVTGNSTSHSLSHNPVPQNPTRNPTSHSPVRLVAQPPVTLSSSNWNGAEGEKVEVTTSAIKPSA